MSTAASIAKAALKDANRTHRRWECGCCGNEETSRGDLKSKHGNCDLVSLHTVISIEKLDFTW